tara:strand:+ start:20436 stop:21122 length:687 start_codon:yes stop_codon:yes gene_type:complete
MIIGHIGARGNSKGLPKKNFKKISGKPLIEWSIDQLIENHKIDAFVVSSDDPEIIDFGLKKGAYDIGIRPKKLATDNASKLSVWKHSLSKIKKNFKNIEIFLDLDCTSPLRENNDISNAINDFYKFSPDMVMSCCEARKNPYFNMVEFKPDGSLKISKRAKDTIVARQKAPIVLEHVASIYAISPDFIEKANSLLDGYVIPYIMPFERSLDIDSKFDFKIVEFLLDIR